MEFFMWYVVIPIIKLFFFKAWGFWNCGTFWSIIVRRTVAAWSYTTDFFRRLNSLRFRKWKFRSIWWLIWVILPWSRIILLTWYSSFWTRKFKFFLIRFVLRIISPNSRSLTVFLSKSFLFAYAISQSLLWLVSIIIARSRGLRTLLIFQSLTFCKRFAFLFLGRIVIMSWCRSVFVWSAESLLFAWAIWNGLGKIVVWS